MDAPTLKDTYPQKYYFKMICNFMYYLGMGDCWYETFRNKRRWYNLCYFISNAFIIVVLLDECLAHFRSDLNVKEKTDLMQYNLAHSSVTAKIMILYYKREQIIRVVERLVEGTRSIFYSLELEQNLMKQWAIYCILVAVSVYSTLVAATVDGIIAHIKEGVVIRTEVVLYPASSDTGFFVNVLRFLIQLHWYFLMAMMLTVDCLTFCSLVTVRYKFKIVQLFYEKMRNDVLENPKRKPRSVLEADFLKDFMTGIKLHEDALWCARNVQHSLGIIYSIQVFESVVLLIVCLFKLIAAEHSMANTMVYLNYIICLILITGAYMMAAGDITFEASLIPTSIFHCGWEMIEKRSDLRVLVVVAIQNSQVPVVMTAFGVIKLSYTNFISVLRSSYSFFAVWY